MPRKKVWTREYVEGKTISEIAEERGIKEKSAKRRIQENNLHAYVADFPKRGSGWHGDKEAHAGAARLGWARRRKKARVLKKKEAEKRIAREAPPREGKNIEVIVHLRMDYTHSVGKRGGRPIWIEASASEVIKREDAADIDDVRDNLRKFLRHKIDAEYGGGLADVFEDTSEMVEGDERVKGTDLPEGHRVGKFRTKRSAGDSGRTIRLS